MFRSIRNFLFGPREFPNKFRDRLEAIDYKTDLIPAYFVCPISQEVMEHPVMVNKDERFTYDRAFIEEWNSKSATDPLSRAKIDSITPNVERVKQINNFITCLETIHKLKKDIEALRDALLHLAQSPETLNLLAEGLREEEIAKLHSEQRNEILRAKNKAKLLLLSEYQKFIALTETAIQAEDKSADEKLAEIVTITGPYRELHDKLAIDLRRSRFGFTISLENAASNPLLPPSSSSEPHSFPLYNPEEAPLFPFRGLFFIRRNGLHTLQSVFFPHTIAGLTSLLPFMRMPSSAEVVLLDRPQLPVVEDIDEDEQQPAPRVSSTALVLRQAASLQPVIDLDDDTLTVAPSSSSRDLPPPILVSQLPPPPAASLQIQPENLDGQLPAANITQSIINLGSDDPVTSLVEEFPPLEMVSPPPPPPAAYMPPTAVVRVGAQHLLLLPPPATVVVPAVDELQNSQDETLSPAKKLD